MPVDPNRYQEACDRGTAIHAWWESRLTPTPLPAPAHLPKHVATWEEEAARVDPGGQAEVHFLLWDYRGQPLVTRGTRPVPYPEKDGDEISWDGDTPNVPDPPKPGATFLMRGTADRLGRGHDGKSPWVEDLKTGRMVSPRSWQLQAYGLMWWVDLGRPATGVTVSVLNFHRNLTKVGQARRKASHLDVGHLFSAWRTFLKLRDRVKAREPARPNPECGLCPVFSSCPALRAAQF